MIENGRHYDYSIPDFSISGNLTLEYDQKSGIRNDISPSALNLWIPNFMELYWTDARCTTLRSRTITYDYVRMYDLNCLDFQSCDRNENNIEKCNSHNLMHLSIKYKCSPHIKMSRRWPSVPLGPIITSFLRNDRIKWVDISVRPSVCSSTFSVLSISSLTTEPTILRLQRLMVRWHWNMTRGPKFELLYLRLLLNPPNFKLHIVILQWRILHDCTM